MFGLHSTKIDNLNKLLVLSSRLSCFSLLNYVAQLFTIFVYSVINYAWDQWWCRVATPPMRQTDNSLLGWMAFEETPCEASLVLQDS